MEPDAELDTWEWADLDAVNEPAESLDGAVRRAIAEAVEPLRCDLATAKQKLDNLARRRGDHALLVPYRTAAALLGIDRARVPVLVRAGLLRDVPCGKRRRIPRVEVERLATEGIPQDMDARRPRQRRGVVRPPTGDVGACIRALPRGRRTA